MQSIAFFDFDGTLTVKDTLLENIKYQKGKVWFYVGFALNAPWLIAYKIKIISNQKAKEHVLRFFFGGMDATAFQKKCDDFATNMLPGLIRQKGLKEIDKHLANGTIVVIVSASAQNWFQKYFEEKNIEIISSTLEVVDEKITGKITGLNCYGTEKTKRIRNSFNLSAYQQSYAYGDTKGDKPMLSLATFPFYKPFR